MRIRIARAGWLADYDLVDLYTSSHAESISAAGVFDRQLVCLRRQPLDFSSAG